MGNSNCVIINYYFNEFNSKKQVNLKKDTLSIREVSQGRF